MATVVITLEKNKLSHLKAYYQSFILPKTVPHALFLAKKNGLTITAYNSGKVMFQGTDAENEAAQWDATQGTSNTQTKRKVPSSPERTLPANFASKSVIGSDEVGNGSYFGPLIVCAVYADSSILSELKALGVKDSKLLTDTLISNLAPKIKEIVPFSLLTVQPEKYNDIQPTYNAVRMKVALHNRAIALLLKKIAPCKPEAILIDQFTPEANYRKYLAMEDTQIHDSLFFKTKGEQYHLAVAAASILCRAQFLAELEKGSAELGFSLPSGAGETSDRVAAEILNRGGLPLLRTYAKLHFANTQKAQKIAKR